MFRSLEEAALKFCFADPVNDSSMCEQIDKAEKYCTERGFDVYEVYAGLRKQVQRLVKEHES